jgi:hypothetical protein
MLCKFKNEQCKNNLIKALVQHWNNNHTEQFHVNENYYENSDCIYVPLYIALDENLHQCV